MVGIHVPEMVGEGRIKNGAERIQAFFRFCFGKGTYSVEGIGKFSGSNIGAQDDPRIELSAFVDFFTDTDFRDRIAFKIVIYFGAVLAGT